MIRPSVTPREVTIDEFLAMDDDSWCPVWTAAAEVCPVGDLAIETEDLHTMEDEDFEDSCPEGLLVDEHRQLHLFAVDVEMVYDFRYLDGCGTHVRVLLQSPEDLKKVQKHIRHLVDQNRKRQMDRIDDLNDLLDMEPVTTREQFPNWEVA